jgi:hypothetical protein
LHASIRSLSPCARSAQTINNGPGRLARRRERVFGGPASFRILSNTGTPDPGLAVHFESGLVVSVAAPLEVWASAFFLASAVSLRTSTVSGFFPGSSVIKAVRMR